MSSPSGHGKEKMEALALACNTACGAPGQCPCNPEACSCKSMCQCKKEKCSKSSSKPAECTDGECPKPAQASSGDCQDKTGACNISKTVDCTNGECMPPPTTGECKDKAGACDKSKTIDCTNGECPPPAAAGKCKDIASAACNSKAGADLTNGGACLRSAKESKDQVACQDPAAECGGEGNNNSQSDKKESGSKGTADGSSFVVIWHAQTSPGGSPQSRSPEALASEQKTCDGGVCPKASSGQDKPSPLPQGDNLKAVLFDIDGTIADSDPIHFLAFQEILVEAGYNGGVPITHEFFIRQMSGKLNYVIAQELLPDLAEEKRIEMMDEKEVRYRQMAAKDLQPIPGFHQFAEYVKKRGLRRAAVTNSPRLNAEQVLTALKITDFFELLVVGNECKHPKPFPDPYLEAINFFGVEPKQCFVLEDSPSGAKAGVAAGAPVVGLLTGHPGPVLKEAGVSVLINDYHDPALWAALGEAPCAQSCSKAQQSAPAATNNAAAHTVPTPANNTAPTVPVSS